MTTTSMMYTLLPNGGPSAGLRLSIFLSPRLEGSGATGTLVDYTLGNWTERVRARFEADGAIAVQLGSALGPELTAAVPAEYVAGLDPELWDAVFPAASTRVAPRVFKDYAQRWIRSYPVRPLEAYIQKLYDGIANDYPAAFPDLKGDTAVTELIDAIGGVKGRIDGVLPGPRDRSRPRTYTWPDKQPATHPEWWAENDLTALAGSMGVPHIPLAAFLLAIRFFKRGNQGPYRSADEPYDPDLVPDLPEEPELDFHQALAALGDYPFLLRKLGLIVDCVLPANAAAALGASGQIQLVTPAIPAMQELTPWTRYRVQAPSGFRPEPMATSDLAHGMLRLDSGDFDVIQTDPDGNVIKVYDYAVNMFGLRTTLLAQKAENPTAPSSQAPEETSLPALRSGGFFLVRKERDDKLWNTVARQATFEADPENAILYADDVLRGYRLDVKWRGAWHSLCRWQGSVDVAGTPLAAPGPGEGYLKAESVTSDPEQVPPDQPQPDLYVHETIAGWRNWSLVAPMPGKAIVPVREPDKRQRESTELATNQAGAGFEIAAHFTAEKRSLPALRYGEDYQFRVRAVDVAGNSLSPPPSLEFPAVAEDAAPAGVGETKSVTYLRYDPVPAPMLIATAPFIEGESMERVVIRSRGDAAPAPLPAELGIDEKSMFQPENPRWVAAPKAHVGEAEAHGVFDELFASAPDVSRNLLKKEAGSFDDLVNLETLDPLDPNRATIVDQAGNTIDPTTLPAGWKKGDPLPDGYYFLHREDPVKLPYLPDPLAHGVAFMPAGTDQVLHRAYASAGWPEAQPFKLLLAGGKTAGFALGGRDARIVLPKGTMLTVKYASAVVPPGGAGGTSPEGQLRLMGRWRGMSDGIGGGKDKTRQHGYQHWMLTPFRTMVLVHAVEKPVSPPVFSALELSKLRDKTYVELWGGSLDLHAPSTGEIEVRARWKEWVDDPASDDGPHDVDKDGHVLDLKVDYDESALSLPKAGTPRPKHELGDTKHRWVYYRAIGSTRYREYFPHKLTNWESLEPDPTHPAIIKKKKLITSEGPEFLHEGEEGELAASNVLSSARPKPPEPLYIVPTFRWEPFTNGRRRRGRGLRIYLKRGWYSSGADELLGIVLLPASVAPGQLGKYRNYVTEWGSDPLFDRVGPTTPVEPANFATHPSFPEIAPRAAAEGLALAETEPPPGAELPLAGAPGQSSTLTVRVVGFEPQYDAERKLWYVDVVMQPTSAYYGFVRFALCRYQPHSVAGVEISRVVCTEFAQLLADRTASLSYKTAAIGVTVSGPSALSKLGKHLNATGGLSGEPGQPAGPGENELGFGAANPPPPPGLIPNPGAGSAHRVVARVESRLNGTAGDLGWEPFDNGVVLVAHTTSAQPGIVYWKGDVAWPRSGIPVNRQYRLAVAEYEMWETDALVKEYRTPGSASGKDVRERLVYVDHFPLDLGPIIQL